MKAFFILVFSLVATSTTLSAQNSGFLMGKVIEITGNHMPSSSEKPNSNPKGVTKEIYVYELTNQKQAVKEGVFYKQISTTFIAKKKTKPNGTFKIKLKPGRYSIFVQEKEGLFANALDGEGNINTATIQSKKITELNLTVDYQAAY